MPIAPPTQMVANVQAAEQRRRLLAQKLAAQMAARSSAVGRQQSVGLNFGSQAYLHAAAMPTLGLGFSLAPGRERPAGYDASAAPTVAQGPPAGGGVGVGSSPPSPNPPPSAPPAAGSHPFIPAPLGQGSHPFIPAPLGQGSHPFIPAPPGQVQYVGDPSGFNSDTPLMAGVPSWLSGGVFSVAPPDPYQVMLNRQLYAAGL